MQIELFEHNQKAYWAAVKMLQSTGKAVVVHPTGTGKSFIGFRLAADHPCDVICWLSPSDYIFRTQLENLQRMTGFAPKNIRFFTYARLMTADEEALQAIRPQYIVLDEFHRCGAVQWGGGVRRLLETFPEVPVLGLSATHIRYLDDRRDMARELFDGNIASFMTLGEAIVRGILAAPEYVTAVYAYDEVLAAYTRSVRRLKNGAARDRAEKRLHALRRSLDRADGLREIFARRLKPQGKYILFCSNVEHMNRLIACVPEWFGALDETPHVYRMYSDDKASEQAFTAFKSDVSDRLKLLFCIDMLNEGIHVDGIDGVVLFRPTVSPIVYRQQIGRALAVGGKTPIILDVVNNFENLCSVGTIEQEMQVALAFYRASEPSAIQCEKFTVYDETRDCRGLFSALNEALSASWDVMYNCACNYFAAYGNLDVPKRYRTAEGYSLGAWLAAQRKIRAGKQYGRLDANRIARLDAIGMVWDSARDAAWKEKIAIAQSYFAVHGNLNVNADTPLGAWLARLRSYRKNGIHSAYLRPDRIAELDRMGMVWDVRDSVWERNFSAAQTYFKTFGHLDVPAGYVDADGVRLGAWIHRQRALKAGKATGAPLDDKQTARLNAIGMKWGEQFTRQWENGYAHARTFFETFGHLDVPAGYVSPDGYRLGAWIANHRERSGIRVTAERRRRLDEIGMVWKKPDRWETKYALAKAYYEQHGDLRVPAGYVVDGIWLYKWLNEQKQIYLGKRKGKKLTDRQIELLNGLGLLKIRSVTAQ